MLMISAVAADNDDKRLVDIVMKGWLLELWRGGGAGRVVCLGRTSKSESSSRWCLGVSEANVARTPVSVYEFQRGYLFEEYN